MNEKRLVKEQFTRSKDAYITSSTHGNKQDLEHLMSLLEFERNMKALDIATGGGHVAKHVATHVKEVIATDLTEAMIENTAQYLSAYENITFQVADAEDLPFPTETFDIITCRIAAHHFPHPEKFIQEVARTLKRNGQFLFVDNVVHEDDTYDTFINTLEKMRDNSHVRALKVSEWTKLFSSSKLNIHECFIRKKTLPFKEWSTRTLNDPKKISEVESYLLQADENIKLYYEVKIVDHHVQSFAIDEWVAVARKIM